MRIIRALTVFLLFTVIFSSCTIQRRTFNRGFHVEWKHALNPTIREKENHAENQSENQSAIELSDTTTQVQAQQLFAKLPNHEAEAIEVTNSGKFLLSETKTLKTSDFSTVAEKSVIPDQTRMRAPKNPDDPDEEYKASGEPVANKAAITSFSLGIAAIILAVIFIAMTSLLIYIADVVAIAGVIFGFISFHTKRKYELTKYNKLGLAGIIISGVALVVVAAFILISGISF